MNDTPHGFLNSIQHPLPNGHSYMAMHNCTCTSNYIVYVMKQEGRHIGVLISEKRFNNDGCEQKTRGQ